MSEKISDVVDPAIKYGGGGGVILSFLASASDEIMLVELAEDELDQVQTAVDQQSGSSDNMNRILEAQELLKSRKQNVVELLNTLGKITPLIERIKR
jgi:hypothetical protein